MTTFRNSATISPASSAATEQGAGHGTQAAYRLEGAVATITLDDGKVNVMSPGMLADINAALDRGALAPTKQRARAGQVLAARAAIEAGRAARAGRARVPA